MAKETTAATFKQDTEKGLVLVDFWAPWCGPCQIIGPFIEEIAEEMKDKVTVLKLNTDESPEVAQQHSVMGIPALLLFKDGELVDRQSGARPKADIVDFINQHA